MVRACGVEIYPLKPAQAQASRATFPTHWGRKGSRLWCITRLVEIDAAPPGAHRMDSPAAWSSLAALQTAWPGCSVDHRNRTLCGRPAEVRGWEGPPSPGAPRHGFAPPSTSLARPGTCIQVASNRWHGSRQAWFSVSSVPVGIGLPSGVWGGLVVEQGTVSAAVCGCFGAIAAALHAAPAASLPA